MNGFTALEEKKALKLAEEVGEAEAWRLTLREKAENDLYFFASEICGLAKVKDWKTGRKRLDPKVHRMMARELSMDDDVLLVYARDHLKSSFTKYYILQQVLKNPYIRIGLWSKTTNLVRSQLANMKKIAGLPIIADLWPEVVKQPWEKDDKDYWTMNRVIPEDELPPQENQVEVFGIETTVTGRHYDLQIYDDPIDKKSVRTAVQIEKVNEWWSGVQSIKDVGAIEKYIGTFYHYRDLPSRIRAERLFENVFIHPYRLNGKLWYSYLTEKEMARRRKRMTRYDFSCQYELNPRPKEDIMFVPPYPETEDFPKDPKWYLTFDPAPTVSSTSDQTGFAAACVSKSKPDKLYFREAQGLKLKPDKLAAFVVKKIEQYRPVRVGIEYGLQLALQYLIDLKLKEYQEKSGNHIRPIFVSVKTGKERKADKLDRTIAAMIRDGRAFFAPGLSCQEIFTQFDFYNPNSEKNDDDVIDAASMMVQTVENFAPSHWVGVEAEEPEYVEVAGTVPMSYFHKDKKKRGWGWQFSA